MIVEIIDHGTDITYVLLADDAAFSPPHPNMRDLKRNNRPFTDRSPVIHTTLARPGYSWPPWPCVRNDRNFAELLISFPRHVQEPQGILPRTLLQTLQTFTTRPYVDADDAADDTDLHTDILDNPLQTLKQIRRIRVQHILQEYMWESHYPLTSYGLETSDCLSVLRTNIHNLGVWFSFIGPTGHTDGRWAHQIKKLTGIITSFFEKCSSLHPSFAQMSEVLESTLATNTQRVGIWRLETEHKRALQGDILTPRAHIMAALAIHFAPTIDTSHALVSTMEHTLAHSELYQFIRLTPPSFLQ